MEEEGYIRIYRKLLKWEWFNESDTFRVWMYCLLNANWEDKKWQGVLIKRGSFITSRKKMAFELNLSEQTLRTSIKRLKSTNNLTIKTTAKYSIISIENYDYYQMNNQQSNQQSNQQLTSNQPTTNQQLTTTNNYKELKTLKELKENNNNIYSREVQDIVDYLNSRYGTNYKTGTSKTRDLIKARINEGFTIEDFKTVIDKMGCEWMNTDMQKYLRPETLFGNKFESYLNREVRLTTKNMKLSCEDIEEFFK